MLPPLRPRYYSISSSPLVSPDVCSITVGVLRGPARSGHRHVHRRRAPGYLARAAGERHRVRLRPAAEHRVPAAGEPARADDHGRGGHRAGAVPRVPAGAGRAARPGRAGRPVAAVLRLPQPRRPTCSTPTSCAATRTDGLVRVENAFSRATDAPLPLRPGRDARLRRRGVGPAAAATPSSSSAATPRRSRRACGAPLMRDLPRTRPAPARPTPQAWLAGPAHDRPVRGGHLGRLTAYRSRA